MSIKTVCDHCEKPVGAFGFGLTEPAKAAPDRHFCNLVCLWAWAVDEEKRRNAAADNAIARFERDTKLTRKELSKAWP